MTKAPWREKMVVFSQQAGLDLVTIPCHPQKGEGWIRELNWWAEESDLFVMALIDGLFWHPEDPLSFQEFILGLAYHDEETYVLIRRKKESTMGLVRRCLEAGAHGCIIGDDLAYDKRPFVSVKSLEKSIFPGLGEISETIKSEKGVAFFHSCGKVTDLLDSIISLGFDGFHGFSPAAGNDLFNAYSKIDNRMVIMGGLDLDDQNIKAIQIFKERIAISPNLMRDYILASAAGLSLNTPLENVRILYEV
jgi:uroporphyrinogen decarboxylase